MMRATWNSEGINAHFPTFICSKHLLPIQNFIDISLHLYKRCDPPRHWSGSEPMDGRDGGKARSCRVKRQPNNAPTALCLTERGLFRAKARGSQESIQWAEDMAERPKISKHIADEDDFISLF
jgi:hypothetical protein